MPVEAAHRWASLHREGRRLLTPFQLTALALVMQHRVLSRDQVWTLLAPEHSRQTITNKLAQLEAGGYLGRTRGAGRESALFVTDSGRQVAAGAVPPRRYEITAAKAEATHAHTLAVNDVGMLFVEYARRGGHECTPWDWEHEIAHPYTDGGPRSGAWVTSDARLRCIVHTDTALIATIRLVEVDRATKTVLGVFEQIRRYTRMRRYIPADQRNQRHPQCWWRREYRRFPGVLLVFTGARDDLLQRRIDAVDDLCLADPEVAGSLAKLNLLCTTMDRLRADGPYARIWQRPDTAAVVPLIKPPRG